MPVSLQHVFTRADRGTICSSNCNECKAFPRLPLPPNATDEVGRRPSPPPLTKDNGLPPAINVAAATQRRVNAMEGPSSRPCRAAVSASGTRLQARLHSAQPHDATKDETVVASPTEQYPLKPSPPPPQSRGCPNAFFIWKGGNPFLFFQDYQMWKWRVYTNQLLFRYDGGNGEGAS
jgi:hypothetical protein